jgi:site-specific recombinase XerD
MCCTYPATFGCGWVDGLGEPGAVLAIDETAELKAGEQTVAVAPQYAGIRHYSATELVAAGVDVRTVAGRLGHSGGGATTLKVYSAWRSEADQRAAGTLAGRMPALLVDVD